MLSAFPDTTTKGNGVLPRDVYGRFCSALERRRRLCLRAWARRRLAAESVLPIVKEFAAARPKDSLPPDYCDLWFLYRTARERKPRLILEFGSGCSTAVFAKAIADNGTGHLISIDAVQGWAESTSEAIPSRVRKHCEIITSPLIECDYDGIRVFRHAHVPRVAPNYVYLDGPPLTDQVQVAVDVLDIEDRLPSDFFLVVDGRRTNTEFLRRHLKKSYRFRHRSVFNNAFFISTSGANA